MIDQKSPCLPVYFSKLGLPSDKPDTFVCWTEKFYVKTDVAAREFSKFRPYDHVWSEEIVATNEQFDQAVDKHSKFRIKVTLGQENVTRDIQRASRGGNILFNLPNRSGQVIPIYQQP